MPAEPIPAPSAPTAPAAGTIAGTLSGHPELVDVIVVLGPDNALHELTRIKPVASGASATFTLSGLAPGLYMLVPMGKSGASLAANPPIQRLTIGSGSGARADFTITAAQ